MCCLMDCAVQKYVIFLLVSIRHTAVASNFLQYIITGTTPGRDFPEYTVVGLVDGEQFVYYDSNIKKMIPKTEWMKKNVGEDYWTSETEKQEGAQEIFRANLAILMERFNKKQGIHTLQRRSGCELDANGTVRGYFQFGYDGEDFLSLDLNTLTWTAANDKAVITKQKWERKRDAQYRKDYLENDCVVYLKKYVEYGKSTLKRQVPPEASVFQKDSSSPVVCHATGFFPKAVMISWQKNGEDLQDEVELRETLPNQDGTFQRRSVLTVSPEELKKNKYTCVVQHGGLEKEVQVLRASRHTDGGSDDTSTGDRFKIRLAVGLVTVLLLVMVVTGVFVWRWWKTRRRGPVESDMSFQSLTVNPSDSCNGEESSNQLR